MRSECINRTCSSCVLANSALKCSSTLLKQYKSPDQAELPHDPESQKRHVGVLLQVFMLTRIYDNVLWVVSALFIVA